MSSRLGYRTLDWIKLFFRKCLIFNKIFWRSFPLYKQLDSKDCGPTCLKMVAAYYGKAFSLSFLREICQISRVGVSLLGLKKGSEELGFKAIGAKISFQDLLEKTPLPCIIHWRLNHFIVLCSVKKTDRGKYLLRVADPSYGYAKFSCRTFKKNWISNKKENLGIVLALEPTKEFFGKKETKENDRLSLSFLKNYIKPYVPFLYFILLSLLLTSAFGVAIPFLTQAIVDQGIKYNDFDLIYFILLGQLLITVGQIGNSWIRNWILLHISSRISIVLLTDFIHKMMRLPISFFDTRLVGDILSRIEDHAVIQNFLTGSLINSIYAIVTLIFFSTAVFIYNPFFFSVFLIGAILHVFWVLLFMKKQKEINYMSFQNASSNRSNTVQMVQGMQEIKLHCCENERRWDWEKIQVENFNLSIKGLRVEQLQKWGATFIIQITNLYLTYLAAVSVIEGNLTLGKMLALQYILGQLNGPLITIVKLIKDRQNAIIGLERMGEIHMKEDEVNSQNTNSLKVETNDEIILRDVSFKYPNSGFAPVLSNINIVIPRSKITAVVGSSGSGKTTLLKLLLGIYSPNLGEITIGGRSFNQYDIYSWRKACGAVMQEGFIFNDTVQNNIIVTGEKENQKLQHALNVSLVSNFLDSLPQGLDTVIGMDGKGVSTGQKQRILIARAIYKNPKYIFLDEATNALDSKNERGIMESLLEFFSGRTVVLAAHRLSTIKNADQIIVMDKGCIVEVGNHESLIIKKEYYYNLVKNQL